MLKLLLLLALGLAVAGCQVPPFVAPSPIATPAPASTPADTSAGRPRGTPIPGSTATPGPLPTTDEGEIQQGVTGGTLTTRPAWVVALTISISADTLKICSASVLSEHYLLTSAHCGADLPSGYGAVIVRRATTPGATQSVYSGRAQFVAHPNWEFGVLLDPEDDIALVRLMDGAINLALTGRAKIYVDYISPIWTLPDRQSFTYAGWGMTDVGGSGSCAEDTVGKLRTASGIRLEPAARDQKDMTARQGASKICPGDSGSPWLFARAGDFLAFAVTSGWQVAAGGNIDRATSIFPKLGWIYQASVQPGCLNLDCYDEFLDCRHAPSDMLGELPFQQCFEAKRSTGQRPDPSTTCAFGQHCCEPGEPGSNRCTFCVPLSRQCP